MSSEGWKTIKLQDALQALIDYRGKTPEKTSYGIPLITAKIVKDGFIEEPTEFIARENYSSWMTRGFPKVGDVVLTTEAPLGEVALIKDSNMALAQRIVTLRGKENVLDSGFLKYFLQSPTGQLRLKERETGTTVTGIKQSELRLVKIDIPSFKTQRRIASVLCSLDDKIELNRQTNQTLEAIAQALFKEWFVDFNFPGATGEMQESELGKIPKGWKIGKLEDILNFKNGKSSPERNDAFEFPVYGANGIIGFSKIFNSKEKSIVIGRVGSFCGAVYYSLKPSYVTENAIIGESKHDHSSMFCFHTLQLLNLNNYKVGSGQPLINQSILSSLKMILPSQIIIERYERICLSIFNAIYFGNKQTNTLITLRDTLLPKLMKGEISIKETEKLTAAAL